MALNKIEITSVRCGDEDAYTWSILDPEERVLAVSGHHHHTRKDCLASLFDMYFGEYDNDSFITLFSEWQATLPKSEKIASAPNGPTR